MKSGVSKEIGGDGLGPRSEPPWKARAACLWACCWGCQHLCLPSNFPTTLPWKASWETRLGFHSWLKNALPPDGVAINMCAARAWEVLCLKWAGELRPLPASSYEKDIFRQSCGWEKVTKDLPPGREEDLPGSAGSGLSMPLPGHWHSSLLMSWVGHDPWVSSRNSSYQTQRGEGMRVSTWRIGNLHFWLKCKFWIEIVINWILYTLLMFLCQVHV